MKLFSTTLLLLFVCALFTQVQAQEIPEVVMTEKTMSMGTKSAFVVKYNDVDPKIVDNQWSKIVKEYKGKVKKNKAKELFADDVKMKELSNNTVDLYATIAENEAEKTTILTVWYDLGGAFLNKTDHPSQAVAVENMLDRTSMRVMAEKTENIVDNEEDKLKDLNKDLSKLEKEKEDGLKEIEEAKKLIEETEKMLEENAEAQGGKKEEISEQETTLEAAKAERAKYPKL